MTREKLIKLILLWTGLFTFSSLYFDNFKELSSEAAGWLGFILFLYGAVTLAETATGGNE